MIYFNKILKNFKNSRNGQVKGQDGGYDKTNGAGSAEAIV
jgi:hypothetical protein